MSRTTILAMVSLLVLLLACGADSQGPKPYEAQDFSKLKGMQGFSDKALDLHFALYQGYVKNTNLLWEELQKLAEQNQTKTPAYAELKRRFGWEFDGMRLHELYFGNLGGKEPLAPDSKLMKKIEENFGTFDKWAADFRPPGPCAASAGWCSTRTPRAGASSTPGSTNMMWAIWRAARPSSSWTSSSTPISLTTG